MIAFKQLSFIFLKVCDHLLFHSTNELCIGFLLRDRDCCGSLDGEVRQAGSGGGDRSSQSAVTVLAELWE